MNDEYRNLRIWNVSVERLIPPIKANFNMISGYELKLINTICHG